MRGEGHELYRVLGVLEGKEGGQRVERGRIGEGHHARAAAGPPEVEALLVVAHPAPELRRPLTRRDPGDLMVDLDVLVVVARVEHGAAQSEGRREHRHETPGPLAGQEERWGGQQGDDERRLASQMKGREGIEEAHEAQGCGQESEGRQKAPSTGEAGGEERGQKRRRTQGGPHQHPRLRDHGARARGQDGDV